MLCETIAIGSLLFWAIIGLAVVLDWVFLEKESLGGLALVTILALTALTVLSPIKPFLLLIVAHPITAILCIFLYLVLGGIYSLFKWDRFWNKVKVRYEEEKTAWLISNRIHDGIIPSDLKVSWSLYVERFEGSFNRFKNERLYNFAFNKVSYVNYKPLITSWIVWWPLSLIWLLIDDPIRKMAEWFIFKFRAVYTWIVNRHRKSIANDIETDPGVLASARTGNRGTGFRA